MRNFGIFDGHSFSPNMKFGHSNAIRAANKNSMEMWTSNGERKFLKLISRVPPISQYDVKPWWIIRAYVRAHSSDYQLPHSGGECELVIPRNSRAKHTYELELDIFMAYSVRLIWRTLLTAQSIHRQFHLCWCYGVPPNENMIYIQCSHSGAPAAYVIYIFNVFFRLVVRM